MGLPRRKKTRLKMLMMIASSSIMVASLATATMAWYSVSVNISVSSSTITIRTPFQYYFYAYNDNGFSIKTLEGRTAPDSSDVFTKGNGYKTTTASHLYDLAYYTEVDALRYLGIDPNMQTAFVDALTEVSGLWPGYKMSFAIKATGLALDDAPRLKITALNPGKAEFDTDNDNNKTVDLKRVSSTKAGDDKAIYMAQAIKIYAKSAATFQDATSQTPAINNVGEDTNWWSTPITLGDAATRGGGNGNNGSVSGEWWYFWTIEFSNDNSTFYGTPTSNTTEGVTTETYAKSTSGDSNAYQGLKFKITTMTLQNDE